MYKSVESYFKWYNSGWAYVHFVLFDMVEVILEREEEVCLGIGGISCNGIEGIECSFEVCSIQIFEGNIVTSTWLDGKLEPFVKSEGIFSIYSSEVVTYEGG